MKVAIIGGGASGMTTAHLLGGCADVTLFERAPTLGGHVCTLGLNVEPDRPLDGVVLDAGVIEFERNSFPTFFRLMSELGVVMESVPATTTLFLEDGQRLLSPGGLLASKEGLPARLSTLAHGPAMGLSRRQFERAADEARPANLRRRPLSAYVREDVFGTWLRLLAMYAYSTPFEAIDSLPAALAVPMLRDFLADNDWYRVPGGVYRWFEAALARFPGRVVTDARIQAVRRSPGGVEVALAGGDVHPFDQVVFAATPDVPLALLSDPTEAERRRFGAWTAREVEVLVHHDTGPYDRRGVDHKTEFDVFALPSGGGAYNAHLNRLCGAAGCGREYALSFGLEGEIDPETVVHRQRHLTPRYTVEAFQWRDEVVVDNGSHRTWHAGAWLGDGLTEGAITSGQRVAVGLGGRWVGAGA